MRRMVPLFVSLVILMAASVSTASAETFNVTIGKGLPVGMKIFVTVGGDGGNCSGGATAEVGRGGTATVTIDVTCTPSGHPPTSGPNANVRVMARALDEATNTQYKGEGKATATSVAGVYQTSLTLKVVPPRP
ncbi:MAG: hypothetical protein AB1806_19870 [Acidobacteriota bacterium]